MASPLAGKHDNIKALQTLIFVYPVEIYYIVLALTSIIYRMHIAKEHQETLTEKTHTTP